MTKVKSEGRTSHHREGKDILMTDEANRHFAEKVGFLSDITGLPITSAVFAQRFKPKLDLDDFSRLNVCYRTSIVLGEGDDIYEINQEVKFRDKYTPGEPLSQTSWTVKHNGQTLNKPQGWINAGFDSPIFFDPKKRADFLQKEFDHVLGGPTTEVAFMNYEDYTLESLQDRDDYFANIYLTLMTDMKARGLPMPPILSKRKDVGELMQRGEVARLEELLRGLLMFEGFSSDNRCLAHMNYEAADILKTAQWEKDKLDPSVPLEIAFPHLNTTLLKGKDRGSYPRHNILVVENDLSHFGDFSDLVEWALTDDGRWNGSTLISEYNLSACMQLCASGRIDLVLFDWRNPSHEEMMMIRPSEANPMYHLFHGDTQAVLNFNEDGEFDITTPDGRTLSREEMEEESEEFDMRNAWMEKIAAHCREKEVIPPPSYIVRDDRDEGDLSKIVAQKLNKPLTP